VIRVLLRRLVWLALILWAVFTGTFFLMRAVPGGPFDAERDPPEALRAAIEARYRLDEPLPAQYLRHLGRALRGDLGPSYRLVDYTVAEVIAEGLPRSLLLGGAALLLAIAIGLGAGVAAAGAPGSRTDTAVMALATAGLALPNFVIAASLVLLAAFALRILPAAGWGGMRHLVLPALCLALPHAAAIARLARTGLLEVMGEDFVRTARAKGLSREQALRRHALRLGALPVVSFLGPAAAGILTGSLVIEQVFAIPGLGSHFVQAALSRDYPLAMGVVLLYTVVLGLANLAVDLGVAALDPRARGST